MTTPATDGQDYPTVAELREAWQQLQAALETALDAATDGSVQRVASTDGPHGEQSVLDSIVFLVWHEAYHMGAIGGDS